MLELLMVMLAIGSPIIVTVFIVHYFRYRADMALRLASLQQELDSKATAELQDEVAHLKERMKTVEMIVTDSNYELLQNLKAMESPPAKVHAGRSA